MIGRRLTYSHMAIYYTAALDRTFRALGDHTRRDMLALLARRGECTVSDLGEPFDIAQPTVSKHVRVLERAQLIDRRVVGRVHFVRLKPKRLNEATRWIEKHRRLWEGALDRLDTLLSNIETEK